MAENISQYRAGKALLALLTQHGLKDAALQQVSAAVAELLEEAGGGAGGDAASAKAGKAQQPQQQQQQQQQQLAVVRHLATADAVLQGLSFSTPRGKFDCGFFSDCLQISNKQTAAEVPYSSIQHVLVVDAVPKQPNTTFLVLVMKSGQPVRQGKNALDLIVVQTKDQPELSLPSPEACQHLGPQLVGAAAVVLSQLLACYLEGITEDTFLTADSATFASSAGDLMIAANKGVQPGWLVPLAAGLCYLGKAGSFMPRASINRICFHRTGATSATFDINIKLNNSTSGGGGGGGGAGGGGGKGGSSSSSKSVELGQIDAAELAKLQGYCLSQRIRIAGDDDESDEEEQPTAAAAAAAAAGDAADSDDDDEKDEDFDPDRAAGRQQGVKRRRLEGGQPAAAAAAAAGGGDSGEDDEEEEEEEEEYDGSDDEDDLSSDPELVATDDMSDVDDEGLGDFE